MKRADDCKQTRNYKLEICVYETLCPNKMLFHKEINFKRARWPVGGGMGHGWMGGWGTDMSQLHLY